MKLDKKLEEKIRKEVLNILEKGGRPDWDIPHTLDSVNWMKKLVKKEGGNEKVLVTAMYFHDSGYPQLRKNYNYEEVIAAKKNHAAEGAKLAKETLKKIGSFDSQEIKQIVYLVKMHDKHRNLRSKDRKMVMDSDGLAQINWDAIPPNLDRENCVKFLEKYYEKERGNSHWHTSTARKFGEKLLEVVYNHLMAWPENISKFSEYLNK
jgi:hypothetical protein